MHQCRTHWGLVHNARVWGVPDRCPPFPVQVNRDTMSFATKLNHIVYSDGRPTDIMKQPQTDTGKFSLPGMLAVKRVDGVPTIFPKDSGEVKPGENMLKARKRD